ncbi:hypothetical protein FS837_002727 [Tulasnella sp. UAMH 9824]|nr:hypothetical protein FS837_002727 [Tulasnella sp. UAMH 9824]
MAITWANSNGTITISQQEAPEHVMPTVVLNPTDIVTLAAENTILSVNSTTIAFTYPLPAAPHNAVLMIWSYSTKKPSSSAVDATIAQHDKMGTATMDLTQSVNDLASRSGATNLVMGTNTQTDIPLSTGVSSHETSSKDTPLTDSEKTIRTHGVLSTTGFLVCLPIGVFIVRFSRTVPFLKNKWFTAHWFVQLIVSGPIIISGWVIGYNAVGEDHFQDSHTRKSLPSLEACYANELELSTGPQPVAESSQASSARQTYPPVHPVPPPAVLFDGGISPLHPTKPSTKHTMLPAITARPIQNYTHALLGLSIIALAFYNVHEGYGDEWLSVFGSDVSELSFLMQMRAWWIAMIIGGSASKQRI